MIDIDACLQDNPDGKNFWVILEDPTLFPEEPPKLKVRVALQEQRRLIDRHIIPIMALNETQEMQIRTDFVGLAFAFVLYVESWEGIQGTYDRAKLTKWFEYFPTVAEAFGRNIQKVLKEFERQYLKRNEVLAKNSVPLSDGNEPAAPLSV
jgi:hypothetical protein